MLHVIINKTLKMAQAKGSIQCLPYQISIRHSSKGKLPKEIIAKAIEPTLVHPSNSSSQVLQSKVQSSNFSQEQSAPIKPSQPVQSSSQYSTNDLFSKAKEMSDDSKKPSLSEKAKFFVKLESEGVLYHKDGKETPLLTPEANEILRSMAQKPLLKDTEKDSEYALSTDPSFVKDANEKPFIGGTLSINEEPTELLKATQVHYMIGNENIEKDTIDISIMLTSEKGNKAGLANYSSTIKISDEQPMFPGIKKGQYATPIYPLEVKRSDFTEVQQITDFANKVDIKDKMEDLAEISHKFEAVPYNSTGVTIETLHEISIIKASMVSKEDVKKSHPDDTPEAYE